MASMISVLSLIFLLSTSFYHLGEARLIDVGGSIDAWKVPESHNNTLNHWAGSVRFHVGDTLVFNYDAKIDSVLQVTKENYESCNTVKPLKEYKEVNTKVKLDVSGPYYFISGVPTNCVKEERLIVVVQSPNHPKPVPGAAPPTPSSNPPTSPTPTSPTPTSPVAPMAPAPAPAKSSANGLVVGNGIFWASTLVAFIGFTLV